jgi:hypothetical protein
MNMIDDVVGKKLPTGRKLQAKVGTGNVQKKLYAATKGGALKNLADNQDLINKIAEKRQGAIRSGKYNRGMMIADYREALKDKTLTKDDKADLKAILKHWKEGEAVKPAEVKAVSSKSNTRADAKKAQLKPSPRRELPEFMKKRRGSTSINANPWAANPNKPGSGGGIGSGLGGGSTISNASSSSGGFTKPPTLH